ncbi:pyridoxamine 5'-phosphate oxidase family protein [Thermoactinospora rubra]|uniref:pyridoxamine 5'-phosphate oxidase family protein n=1 Tax=Thermoactinospora rubra TaxID=1088767 RepID=UPI000A11CB8D|nr:pyridoxamine 5'-phosphate oxidase family protein [Thermoactinospora rubra]
MRCEASRLVTLSPRECLDLLSSAEIGRIVFTDRALPAVQPVNFRLDGDRVVIRTAAGSKLAAATRNAIVAFEADDIDPASRTGWSVTAIGHARAVEDPCEVVQLATLRLECWAPGERDHFIEIRVEHISGRKIMSGRVNGNVRDEPHVIAS